MNQIPSRKRHPHLKIRGNKLDLGGNNVWFTSDYHLYHKNVIRYDGRPFQTLEEMHQAIRENHNSVVGQNDYVIYLGDLAFINQANLPLNFLNSLNGNFIFVRGNHDDLLLDREFEEEYGDRIFDLLEVVLKMDRFICCHYPMLVWNRSHLGTFHVFGHVHGHLPEQPGRSMDVGIMTNNFFPYSAEEVAKILIKRPIYAPDIHRSVNKE